MRGAVVLLAFVLPTAATAGWFDLSVGSDAVQASGGSHRGGDAKGRFAFGLRGLYDDAHDAKIGGAVLRLASEGARAPGLDFAVGMDLLAGRGEHEDVGAAPLAIEVVLAPPSWRGLFVAAHAAYAPSLLTWGDSDRLLEWAARAGYRITPKIDLFAEYRKIEADSQGRGRHDLSDAASVGFGGRF